MPIPCTRVAALLCLATATAIAQPTAPDDKLGESIVFIKNQRVLPVDLETTLFLPKSSGSFPVVVINHGKDLGDVRFQSRSRPLPAVREFLKRGYAVVVPNRQGFSKSGGTAVGEGCNIAGNGEAQAADVKAVVAWIEKQPWADVTRMVMMGQSHGGLTTLAYAQDPHPGFKLFVNFAGGLKYTQGCRWEAALRDAYRSYGARIQTPTLWFYGENDSYFPPPVIGPAFDAFVKAGGVGDMVAYGRFGSDAHAMFASYDGVGIWWPKVADKLAQLGMPVQPIFPEYDRGASSTPRPAATGFAQLDDLDRIPYLRMSGREGYKTFLAKNKPRAFALGPGGNWAWAQGGEDPLKRALDTCNSKGQTGCRLYAVDDAVVWQAEP